MPYILSAGGCRFIVLDQVIVLPILTRFHTVYPFGEAFAKRANPMRGSIKFCQLTMVIFYIYIMRGEMIHKAFKWRFAGGPMMALY